jgi:hypothetical protein
MYFLESSFNANEIEKVLTSIGPEKFLAIVSDAESAMQMARKLITEKYPYILSICYMAHHLNRYIENMYCMVG